MGNHGAPKRVFRTVALPPEAVATLRRLRKQWEFPTNNEALAWLLMGPAVEIVERGRPECRT
jgi:hypothetical protein